MASAIENGIALWTWPLMAAQLTSDYIDTLISAGRVINARTSIIAAAWSDPLSADHRELTRMVTEKATAFRRGQRAIMAAEEKICRVSEANARTLGRLSGSGWFGWSDWAQVLERNLEIAMTLATLPSSVLAPIHSRTTANARRLNHP